MALGLSDGRRPHNSGGALRRCFLCAAARCVRMRAHACVQAFTDLELDARGAARLAGPPKLLLHLPYEARNLHASMSMSMCRCCRSRCPCACGLLASRSARLLCFDFFFFLNLWGRVTGTASNSLDLLLLDPDGLEEDSDEESDDWRLRPRLMFGMILST